MSELSVTTPCLNFLLVLSILLVRIEILKYFCDCNDEGDDIEEAAEDGDDEYNGV